MREPSSGRKYLNTSKGGLMKAYFPSLISKMNEQNVENNCASPLLSVLTNANVRREYFSGEATSAAKIFPQICCISGLPTSLQESKNSATQSSSTLVLVTSS